jgi:hypothetical protein
MRARYCNALRAICVRPRRAATRPAAPTERHRRRSLRGKLASKEDEVGRDFFKGAFSPARLRGVARDGGTPCAGGFSPGSEDPTKPAGGAAADRF